MQNHKKQMKTQFIDGRYKDIFDLHLDILLLHICTLRCLIHGPFELLCSMLIIVLIIYVLRVVKRSNRGLDTLVNKGEINTEEANFKRHKVSTDRYFHLPNLVGQKDFHLPKRNFHLPNGSLVGALRHPAWGCKFCLTQIFV